MKTEKTLAIITLIGFTLDFLHLPLAGIILTLSLSAIAVVYFAGFYFFRDGDQNNLALSIVGGLMLSLAPIGILFQLMEWPGGSAQSLMGAVNAFIILGIALFLKRNAAAEFSGYYRNMSIRTAIFGVLALLAYLI